MATTDTPAATKSEQVPLIVETAHSSEMTPFESIVARMKGTGRIVGDIVSPDPEPWDCEVE
jgi:hypothetical protein